MCGIVAVLGRPPSRISPDLAKVLDALGRAAERVSEEGDLDAALAELLDVDRELRGTPGLSALLGARDGAGKIGAVAASLSSRIERLEKALDDGTWRVGADEQERINAVLISLKDAAWAILRDRLGMAAAVADLIPAGVTHDHLDGWWAIQVALQSIDRLEVRGRDSAGVHVLVADPGAGVDDPEFEVRSGDPLYRSGSVRGGPGWLGFVYKAAAEIGELGDNVAAIRAQIRTDALLARAISTQQARVTVIGHTRWASVGMISEPNAHPVDSEELGRADLPYVIACLNGDVDNHADLRLAERLSLPADVTTDAKVIPTLVARRMAEESSESDAFVETVTRFDGSVAIAAGMASDPDSIQLAQAGSGQSLFVGLAEDAFVVASEPYGLVEEASTYVRLDCENTQGVVAVLSREGAGSLDGLTMSRYDGVPIPLTRADEIKAEVTTRDIDRAGFPHFLLKELNEAPASFRKTLRGRITPTPGGTLEVTLGPETIPAALRAAVVDGTLRRAYVIGQGTAAVAGQAVAAAMHRCLPDLLVTALPATELSGFGLSDDMSDALVVAISQSGTTTDTNRTVDLVRTRGAHVVAVVNRRGSDLAAKAHGVLHTSDGRDVEMSVASTKAFYSQVAAGWLLAGALAQIAGDEMAAEVDRIMRALRDLPAAMEEVLTQRDEIGRTAAAVAPPRRYWAVVGSGPDKVAAAEVRIKLSELCYRSISSDATEDKKHIDLSCEPMILVCASGLQGPNADDVAKEVAIYRAHKAAPVVIASEGESERFRLYASDVVTVPHVDADLAFVLSAMVGHLFGYEAALSIDAQARPLREARAAIEAVLASGPDDMLNRLRPELERAVEPFIQGLRRGEYNGNLEAATAVRVVGLLRYATGVLPLEVYEQESGKIGTPTTLASDLLDALGSSIDELTRPVDAIRHQAKTVTVGISRSEEALFGVPLVKATLGAGAAPDTLGYRALRTLGALDEAVEETTGYTRYRIDWPAGDSPTISVIDQGGSARSLRSRTDRDPRLLGTKHRAADEREVTVARGASDGRTVIMVPEAKGAQVIGMTLLHVNFRDRLEWAAAKRVLAGYRTRYSALSDAVTETEPTLDDTRLGDEPIVDLLTEPVYELAKRWRRS